MAGIGESSFKEVMNMQFPTDSDVDELISDVVEVERVLQENNVGNVIDVNEIYEKLEELTYIDRKKRIEYVARQLLCKLGVNDDNTSATPEENIFRFAVQHERETPVSCNLSSPDHTLPVAFKQNCTTNVLPSEAIQSISSDVACSNAFYTNRDVLMNEAQYIYSIVSRNDLETIYRCLESHKDNSSRVQLVMDMFLNRNSNFVSPKQSCTPLKTVNTPNAQGMIKKQACNCNSYSDFSEKIQNSKPYNSGCDCAEENARIFNTKPVRVSVDLFHNGCSYDFNEDHSVDTEGFLKTSNPFANIHHPFNNNAGCIQINDREREMDANGSNNEMSFGMELSPPKENQIFKNRLKQSCNEIDNTAHTNDNNDGAMVTNNLKEESSVNLMITEEAKFMSGMFPHFEHEQILEYLSVNKDIESRVEVVCEKLMAMQESMISETVETGPNVAGATQITYCNEASKGAEVQEKVEIIELKEKDRNLIDLDSVVLLKEEDAINTDGRGILMKENCECASLVDDENVMVTFDDELPDVLPEDESVIFDMVTTNFSVSEEQKTCVIDKIEIINEVCSDEVIVPAVNEFSELDQVNLDANKLNIQSSSKISDFSEREEEESYELCNDIENCLRVSPATSTDMLEQPEIMEALHTSNENLCTFGEDSNIKEGYKFTFMVTEKGKHMEELLGKDICCDVIMEEVSQEEEKNEPIQKVEEENEDEINFLHECDSYDFYDTVSERSTESTVDSLMETICSKGNGLKFNDNIAEATPSKELNILSPIIPSVSISFDEINPSAVHQLPRIEPSNNPPQIELPVSQRMQQDTAVLSEPEPSTSPDNTACGSNFSDCAQNMPLIEPLTCEWQTNEIQLAYPPSNTSQGCRKKQITHEEFLSKLPHVDMVFLEETWKRIGNNYFAVKEFIAEQLEEVSSEDKQYLMLMSLFPQADPKFLLQVAKEVGNDEAKLKNFIEEQLQEDKSEPRYVTLLAMFPQEDPKFLQEKCSEIGNDDVAMRNFVVELIKKNEGVDSYETLLAMFPESDPAFLQEIVNRIGDDEEAMKVFVTQQLEEEEDSVEFRTLLAVLPDADPEYLQDVHNKLDRNEESMKIFLLEALENKDYPTREMYLKRQERAAIKRKYHEEFNIQEFLEMFPQPWTHFRKIQHKSDKEQRHAKGYLESRYPRIPWIHIENTYKKYGYNLLNTCDWLDKWIGPWQENRVIFQYAISSSEDIPVEFLQETAFVENQCKIREYQERLEKEKKEAFELAKANGELLECQCCYENELLDQEVATCNEGHIFCKNCIKRSAEIAISDDRCHFLCLTNCLAEFSPRVIQGLLKPTVFSKMLQRRQMEEVQAAGIADLETCPFCDFATIPAANDKVFMCLNPECMRDSCRKCKRPNHIPLHCNEVETKEVKMRTYIEDRMTDALVRTCWRCNRKFIKETGCNKMTCRCGAAMCYICRKPVTDYNHFNGQGGSAFERCPLFSEIEDIHLVAVMEEGLKAKKEVQAQNPDIELKHDPTKINLLR